MAHEVCSPWITPDEMCCEGDADTTDCGGADVPLVFPFSDEDYALAASNILFARTGYLYPGECEAAIWPCVSRCPDPPYPCVTCRRPGSVQVPSGGFAFQITDVEITENGVALDPDTYRIERKNWIVRLDGLQFVRNDFGLTESGVETIITYSYGKNPPIELRMAAADLACELKKACNGNDCALLPFVRRVARQGVEIELADLQKLLDTGMTGIPSVDFALSVHANPSGDSFMDPAAPPTGWGPA